MYKVNIWKILIQQKISAMQHEVHTSVPIHLAHAKQRKFEVN